DLSSASAARAATPTASEPSNATIWRLWKRMDRPSNGARLSEDGHEARNRPYDHSFQEVTGNPESGGNAKFQDPEPGAGAGCRAGPRPGFIVPGTCEGCFPGTAGLVAGFGAAGGTGAWGGATGALGVTPDLVALAKSIGGGLPLGAFGGKREYMDQITMGRVIHLGTYNGNPLCMAAAKAVLSEVCTPQATAATIGRNKMLVDACNDIIDAAGLPAHTIQFGAKGCVTWAPEPIRNYRDYRRTDLDLAFAQWIHGINRGILLPPGLDEQWLISIMHTEADAMRYADVFADFVDELTS
ncbi:MAG: aminotransferase class III-fold pyridoxal phosphate-dependent enzyme, partial [Acidimicrobiia bacterium]|nr:aminotransferase class III-fold pyridoxal phosphate-dependent enzyme [Acidimicrobiia bacterium]